MEDLIRVQENFYILATSSLAAEHPLVLKQGETFGIFDPHGDVVPIGLGEQGVYHQDTRYLSRLELKLGRSRPLFLSSTVRQGNDLLLADLTNPDIVLDEEGTVLPRGTLHIYRSKFIWQGCCHERFRLSNHGLTAVRVSLGLVFDADFVDIFEVRGTRREARGSRLPPRVESSTVVLPYRGLDGFLRSTRLDFQPAPRELGPSSARFEVKLDPQEDITLELIVTCEPGEKTRLPVPFEQAQAASESYLRDHQGGCRIETSNEAFNAWLDRSSADLRMMVTETEHGPYPFAGVPWFSTLFGRDGIITALETLWLDPSLARGVLANLSALQALESAADRDAEPGKILHELRKGEMALLGEVPFGRYYGSVDGTPLFVMLAAAYYERTGDRELTQRLWPHVEHALQWIDTHGDRDRDGFVEYARRSPTGLVQQGWKDSNDSVFHHDGRLAEAPIALCEVQAYVYAARLGAAHLAAALGEAARAEKLEAQAQELRTRFGQRFWCEELETYALALDGDKNPCRVRTSNAGHALYTGIASPEHARRAGKTLLDDLSFSGWGVRTVSAAERRYNPMSYHNGSIWPHDNALVAAGLARYGLKTQALRILTALHDACTFFDLHRMPELFCGFKRRPGEGPTLYPVACAPQAWAAGAVFLLLQACLGLQVDGGARRLLLHDPVLPDMLGTVHIQGLAVGDAVVDLTLRRHREDVGVHVTRRQGDVSVLVAK